MAEFQHIVLMKFKPDVSSQEIDRIFVQLADLPAQIPGLTYYAGGPYSSDEGRNKGYTHGFLMTFQNAEALANYQPHPAHQPVKAAILAAAQDVLAFDFEA